MSLILATIGCVAMIMLRLRRVSLLAPASLYIAGQIITLSIAYLKIDPMMTDFSLVTWLVWGGSCLAFMLGVLVATILPVPSVAYVQSDVFSDLKLIRIWLAFVVAIYSYGMIMGIMKSGGFPMFAKDPEISRFLFQQPRLWGGLCQHASWILVAFSPVVYFTRPLLVKYTMALLFVAGASYGLLTGFRLSLMFAVFSLLFSYDSYKKQIGVLKFGLVMSIVTILLFVMLLARAKVMEIDVIGNFPLLASVVSKWMYQYLANNFWNLDYALLKRLSDDPQPLQWGGGFLNMPLGVLQMIGPVENAYGWGTWRNEGSVKIATLNTISYQWFLVKDFGWIWSVAFPFVWGVIAQRIYQKVLATGSRFAAVVYVPLGFSILFSFFLFMFLTPMYWVFWVLLLVARMMKTNPDRSIK